MAYSVGRAIREVKSNKITHSYFLSGSDYFLQKFFIKNLSIKISNNLIPIYLNFEEENDLNKFSTEISSNSLFSQKAIYVVRNFTKISLKEKNEILNYFTNPNPEIITIFVVDDYYSKNKFIKSISEKSFIIDTRTPFSNKIKQWVDYYIKLENLDFDNHIIENLINSHNDDISNIINEIEKIYLYNNKPKIRDEDLYEIYANRRNIRPWNLLDSLGEKNINKCIENLDSLFLNGFSSIPIIINISIFLKAMMLFNLSTNYSMTYNGLNKIINSKLSKYSMKYSIEEMSNILIDLKNIDILIKSTTLNHQDLLLILLLKICNNFYAK